LSGLDLRPANVLHLDLFPAVVTDLLTGLELGDELRVAVTDNYLYVLTDTPDGPEMLFQEPMRDFFGHTKTGYTAETAFNMYHIKRAPNCGCGASLRGIYLFTDLPYIPPTPRT
jgi:hypothetical protein